MQTRVLYFGAEWCNICHAFEPKVKEACEKKGFEFIRYDADKDEEIFAKYNVRNIPYVILEDEDTEARGMAQDFLNYPIMKEVQP